MEWILILIAVFVLKNISEVIAIAVTFVVMLIIFIIKDVIEDKKDNSGEGEG